MQDLYRVFLPEEEQEPPEHLLQPPQFPHPPLTTILWNGQQNFGHLFTVNYVDLNVFVDE